MSDNKRGTGSYHRDPRVDRLISWALTTTAILALAIGSYFFKGLNASVQELNSVVVSLKTEVAVLGTSIEDIQSLKSEIVELRGRIRQHEAKGSHPTAAVRLTAIERRVLELERAPK